MFKIKQRPEDFRVKEILPLDVSKGDYCYFLMEKKNWTTLMAIQKLAERTHTNPKAFSVGGMKDKNAITEQHVACYGLKWGKIKNIKIRDIKLKFLGYGKTPIRLGSVAANEFYIIVRNLERPLSPTDSICNYYDDQRFGGTRHNSVEVGKRLLSRDFEGAMKHYLSFSYPEETEEHKNFRKSIIERWGNFKAKMVPKYLPHERSALAHLEKHPKDFVGAFKAIPKHLSTLFVHAYQSFLFNKLLSKYIEENFSEPFEIEYCFGKLFATDKYINKSFPLVGYDYNEKDESVLSILEEEGLSPERFKFKEIPYLSSRTTLRKASAIPEKMSIEEPKKDELNKGKFKQKVSFLLGKGSYATMVVKHMYAKSMKV